MGNKRLRAAQNKVRRRRSNSDDFINLLSDDILIIILSLMPTKDAVVTSSISKRWRFLWRHLFQLNFDSTKSSNTRAKHKNIYYTDQKYEYNLQVYYALRSYIHPNVKHFKIRYDFDEIICDDINNWLQRAKKLNVEILELYLNENSRKFGDPTQGYNFPFQYSVRGSANCPTGLRILKIYAEMIFLQKLVLKNVNVSDAILHVFITKSPNLETISIHGSRHFTNIQFGGRDLNLKHFEISYCFGIKSISLYGFQLESFIYKGPEIELRLTDLPNLIKVDTGEIRLGSQNNVFKNISSCVSHLQVLSLNIYRPKECVKLNFIPELPNVKQMRLTFRAQGDESLLEFISLATCLCPSLETLSIELLRFSPMKKRRNVMHVSTNQPHEHLKLFKISGYYGRIRDLELVTYILENAAELKKIVIDPRFQAWKGCVYSKDFLKMSEQEARSAAKCQLIPILPGGVELVIL